MSAPSSSRAVRIAAVGLAACLLLAPAVARARPADAPAPAAPAAEEDAVRRYGEGRKLLEAGDYANALTELSASFQVLPSPNTELLIGHCYRLSGQRVEAGSTYLHVIATAGDKVRQGEERFQATLEEAGRWLATLRVALVEVDVFVSGAPTGSEITIDGKAVPSTASPRGVGAKLLREPGPVAVTAKAPDGTTVTGSAEGAPGATVTIDLDLTPHAAPPPPPPPPPSEHGLGPPPLPTWIAAGVGVAGLATFGIFGAMSSGAASDLDACAPSCPDSLRDTADSGSRDQTIANVGLVVGATGLVAAGVLWIVWPHDTETDRAARSGGAPAGSLRLRVSPAGSGAATVRF